jgi:hypothetical protein
VAISPFGAKFTSPQLALRGDEMALRGDEMALRGDEMAGSGIKNGSYLLGNTFLRQFYTIFDYGNTTDENHTNR